MASGFVFMLYITFYGSAIPCYPTAHCLTIISFMGLILKLPFSSLSSTEYAFQMKVQRILCKMFFNYNVQFKVNFIFVLVMLLEVFSNQSLIVRISKIITLGLKLGKGLQKNGPRKQSIFFHLAP